MNQSNLWAWAVTAAPILIAAALTGNASLPFMVVWVVVGWVLLPALVIWTLLRLSARLN